MAFEKGRWTLSNRKLFICLVFVFILMTVIGTLSHEFGHYTAARLLGYEAAINYQQAWNWDPVAEAVLERSYAQHRNEIINGLDFPGKGEYMRYVNKYRSDDFFIILGGPLQTMLTGSIGLLLLIPLRKKFFLSDKIKLTGWCLIFLTLFWLRQPTNLFTRLASWLWTGKLSMRGDEARLAHHLQLNTWTIQVATGIIGAAVLLYVVWIIPKHLRRAFLLAGLIGGGTGYYLWLYQLGPLIMP